MLTMYSEWAVAAPKHMSLFVWLEPSGIVFMGMYNGDPSSAEFSQLMTPFAEKDPEMSDVRSDAYSTLQSQFDEGNAPRCYYWSSSTFLPKLSRPIIDVICDQYSKLPKRTNMEILHLGGAVGEFSKESTPFTAREACHEIHTISNWDNPSEDFSAKRKWAHDLVSGLAPHRVDVGGYVNFNLEENLQNSFGKNFQRLQKVKTMYDPMNIFKFNHNIKPSQ